MFFDTHIHTSGFSFDGKIDIKELIIEQTKSNIGIVITEHMDYDFFNSKKIEFNVEEYFNTYNKYRSESLLLGIEVGMQNSCLDRNKKLIKENSFDMVLASTHLVNGLEMHDMDLYRNKTKEQTYNEYFKTIFENIKIFQEFDTMTHIDFITRYAPYENPQIEYEKHMEIIDEILKCLIQNGKLLELNSKRLNNKEAIKDMYNIYNRYSELNGKYITIGSDAHRIEEVSRNFENAKEIIKKCNLVPVYFKDRKMYKC